MGKPVKIDEMARHMIRLSGLTVADDTNPDGDIEIIYPGLRSGEKLFEELLIDGDVSNTRHSRIMCAQEASLSLNELSDYIERFQKLADQGDTSGLVSLLAQLVDGYEAKAEVIDIMDGERNQATA
jgi:FlaA1/EpsC-like NDP-sugar epimerase